MPRSRVLSRGSFSSLAYSAAGNAAADALGRPAPLCTSPPATGAVPAAMHAERLPVHNNRVAPVIVARSSLKPRNAPVSRSFRRSSQSKAVVTVAEQNQVHRAAAGALQILNPGDRPIRFQSCTTIVWCCSSAPRSSSLLSKPIMCRARCSLISRCRGTGCETPVVGLRYQSCFTPCRMSTPRSPLWFG